MAAFTLSDVNYPTDGYILLTWDNSEETLNWYQWRVYRRLVGDPTWELIHTISTQATTYEYRDYLAPSNVQVEYAVVQAESTDGGQTVTEGTYDPQQVTPPSDKYWLIHPTDSTMNVLLHHVVADTFADESEEAVLNVIGRGRKVDRGEEWGLTGQLSLKFRDRPNLTGRQQWQNFLALKRAATYVHLRNPFGDVLKVALGGNPSTERESGISIREHHTVTVPYYEVA